MTFVVKKKNRYKFEEIERPKRHDKSATVCHSEHKTCMHAVTGTMYRLQGL